MNNVISVVLLAAGVVLIIFGVNESHSFSSDVSRFFTGSPTDRSMWLLVAGSVSLVAGLVLLFQHSKGT